MIKCEIMLQLLRLISYRPLECTSHVLSISGDAFNPCLIYVQLMDPEYKKALIFGILTRIKKELLSNSICKWSFRELRRFLFPERRRMSESSSSQQDSFPDWAAPIAACIRSFKGGTLIVHSAPFRDALVEAERIVSTNWQKLSPVTVITVPPPPPPRTV